MDGLSKEFADAMITVDEPDLFEDLVKILMKVNNRLYARQLQTKTSSYTPRTSGPATKPIPYPAFPLANFTPTPLHNPNTMNLSTITSINGRLSDRQLA
jgi:hypothetical protein